MTLRYFCLAALLIFASEASAYQISLNRIFLTDQYYKSTWEGQFQDFSGSSWNQSSFYEVQNVTWTLKTEFIQPIYFLGDFFLLHRLDIDSGVKTPAQSITSHLKYGIGFIYLWGNSGVSMNFDGVIQSGARNRESICIDDFDREFHCGNGLPWSMYRKQENYKDDLFFRIQYIRRF